MPGSKRRYSAVPLPTHRLPIFLYLGCFGFRPSLLPLIVCLTGPLADRLQQTCRLLRA